MWWYLTVFLIWFLQWLMILNIFLCASPYLSVLLNEIILLHFFFSALGFELRASHLLDRHFSTWGTSPALLLSFLKLDPFWVCVYKTVQLSELFFFFFFWEFFIYCQYRAWSAIWFANVFFSHPSLFSHPLHKIFLRAKNFNFSKIWFINFFLVWIVFLV
jgi:hypothetical protein